MDNIRNNEQNKQQDNRALRDNFKNIEEFMKDSDFGGAGGGDRKREQEQKNRELRDNFKDIPKFMKGKGYE